MNIKSTITFLAFSLSFLLPAQQMIARPLASEPTVQTQVMTANPGSCNEIDLVFVPGDGFRRLIVCSADVPVTATPTDGNGYSSGSLFGTGSNLGNNNFVVYNSTGSSTTVTGLAGGHEYYFTAFEFNGTGNQSNYLLPNAPTSNAIASGFTMTVSSSSGDMCAGGSVRLEVHGAVTYHWSPSGSLTSSTDSVVFAHPSSTTQYTVDGADNSGCSDQKTISITVYQLPNVTLGNFTNKCINGGNITLTSGSPSGGTYSGSGVSGNHFNPATAGVGRHVISYTYSDIHGCHATDTSSVLVLNSPTVALSTFNDVCINSQSFTLAGGTPAGGAYSGTGVTSGQFNPAASGIGSHVITYIYADSAGCSDTTSRSINVRALPTVTFATLQSVCLNTSPFTLSGGTPAGGTYSGVGVTNPQFSPLVSGAGNFLLTYTYTDSFNCTSSDTSYLRVHTLPSVNFASLNPVCFGSGPVTLTGGTPVGGTYSGPGVGNGIFYSGVAGIGQHTIVYSYSNSNNCTNSATEVMTVNPPPYPNLGPDITVCDNFTAQLNGGVFSSYGWSTGSAAPTITVDSVGHGFGVFSFWLAVANSFGCTNRDTINVTFDACDGVNEIINGQAINVYPNPFADHSLLISSEGSDLTIFDMKGSAISENKNIPAEFSFGEDLSSGSYIIRVRKGSNNTYKLVLKK